MTSSTYTPEWGIKVEQRDGSTTAGIIPAATVLTAILALFDANPTLDPASIERLDVFRVRNIGGPEL